MEFSLDHDHIPEGFFQENVLVGGRHPLFATDHQLGLLHGAKRWYVDGTFKLVKAPFVQGLSIHAFLRQGDSKNQVPLLFILILAGVRMTTRLFFPL